MREGCGQVAIGGWVYIYSFTHNLEDFECQPDCRPTSKTSKVVAGVLGIYVPGGLHSLLYT